ncbi:MAG: FliM/FliN family flagellar motor switch protein [Buchnera aphidicola (Kaburagia rhusicola ensigallis)]
MINNVILKVKKDDMSNEIQKIKKTCIYNSNIDYYTMYQTKKSLMMIFDLFSKKVSLALFDIINVECSLELDNIQLERYNECKNNFLNARFSSYFQIFPSLETGMISLSNNIIPSIIDIVFGGQNIAETFKNDADQLTMSEINIMNKILNIIETIYSFSWKNKYNIDFKFSNFQLIQKTSFKHIFDNNEMFLFTIFKLNLGSTLGYLNICFPFSVIKTYKEKLVNTYKKNDVTKKKIDQISLPMLYDMEIHLDIKLVNFSLLLSHILELKIGDIISINTPEDIMAYSYDVPILVGKYKMYKKKHAFFVKDFLNLK